MSRGRDTWHLVARLPGDGCGMLWGGDEHVPAVALGRSFWCGVQCYVRAYTKLLIIVNVKSQTLYYIFI